MVSSSPFRLLGSRRFLPLFVTQFLNALNDNVFKNAMVILITYRIASGVANQAQLLVTIAAAVYIFPFFIFSATAGQLADKYEKTKLTRIIKFFEIIFMVLGAYSLYRYSISLMMITLFLMGMHSTFFSPIKYALLPEHLSKHELLAGNGLIEAGTFLAILLGTLLGCMLIVLHFGLLITSLTMLSVAILGWISSFFIPSSRVVNSDLKLNKNILQETISIMHYASQKKDLFITILGISWFWLVGGTFISQFPTFTNHVLHASSTVVSMFLGVFSLGVAGGSLLCNRLLAGKISTKYVTPAILAMSVFMADIHFAALSIHYSANQPLLSIPEFLRHWNNWRIIIDFILLSVACGIYVVPLFAILQIRTKSDYRARVIACNNVVNSLFMVLSSGAIIVLLACHFSITEIFLVVAIVNAFVAFYFSKLMPRDMLHSFLKKVCIDMYRFVIQALEDRSKKIKN